MKQIGNFTARILRDEAKMPVEQCMLAGISVVLVGQNSFQDSSMTTGSIDFLQ